MTKQKYKIGGIFLLIVILTFTFYLSDLKDYGGTWDELIFHKATGERYVKFLKTGDIKPILDYENSAWFPPIAPTVAEFLVENKQLEKYFPQATDRFHIAAVLFGSFSVGILFLITFVILNNYWLAIYASLLLVFYPQFVSQSHNNVRDIGLTFFYSATILILLIMVKMKKKILGIIFAGFLAGLTTDTKQNGAFLILIALAWLIFMREELNGRRFFLYGLIFLTFFLLSFILFWPYLWIDTLNHILAAWNFLTNPKIIAGTVTFFDKTYTNMNNLPFYYPLVMLALVTSPILILLILIGIIGSLTLIFLGKHEKIFLMLAWFFVPLSRFMIPKSAIAYDQIRHFLEIVPVLFVFSAIGVYFLYKKFGDRMMGKYTVVLFSLVVLFYNIFLTFKYRPHGTAYFNFLAGSSDYVSHAFDVEYYGNVYRQATNYLNKNYGENAKYYVGGLGVHILNDNKIRGQLTEDINDEFDFVIFMNKQNWVRGNPYLVWLINYKEPIYTIERGGKILFYQFLPYKDEYLSLRN